MRKDFKSDPPGELTMTLTPDMETIVKENFNLEIEMLQGKKRKLKDGRVWYKITVNDPQKCEIIIEFILKCISKDVHKPESKN